MKGAGGLKTVLAFLLDFSILVWPFQGCLDRELGMQGLLMYVSMNLGHIMSLGSIAIKFLDFALTPLKDFPSLVQILNFMHK